MGLVGSLERRWNRARVESEAAAILEAAKTGDGFARLNKVFKKSIHEDYELSSTVVGTGFSGPVRLGTHKLSGRSTAIKRYDKLAADAQQIEYLKSEAEIYLSLDHPNVCKLYGIYEDKRHLWLVMEYCQGQELYHRLLEKQVYSEADASELSRQMLEAIHYLHSHSIVHRDLKLENWLYESSGTDTGRLKLIDFGFSRTWNPKRSKMMEACCGSLTYVSPDTLSGSYTNACDMWSLGVMVYFLLVGVPPFFGTEKVLIDRISRGSYSMDGIRWRRISEEAKAFVRTLLAVDPRKRLTSRQALDHPWISNCAERARLRYNHPIDYRVLNSMRQFAVASHLKRAALTLIAYSLTTKEIEELATIFHRFDLNQNGRISLANFKEVMLQNFSISTREIEQLFNAMGSMQQQQKFRSQVVIQDEEDDAEEDLEVETGICYSDFVAALLQTRIQFHQDTIREAFLSLDADQSGYITTEDLRKVIGNSFEGADVDEVIQAADVNGDGRIDYEEFLHAVLAETKEDFRLSSSDDNDKIWDVDSLSSAAAPPGASATAEQPETNKVLDTAVEAPVTTARANHSLDRGTAISDTEKRRGRFLKQLGGFVDSSLIVQTNQVGSAARGDFSFCDTLPPSPAAPFFSSLPRSRRLTQTPPVCEQTLCVDEIAKPLPSVAARGDNAVMEEFTPPANHNSSRGNRSFSQFSSTSPPCSPCDGRLANESQSLVQGAPDARIKGTRLVTRREVFEQVERPPSSSGGAGWDEHTPSRAKAWDSRLLSGEPVQFPAVAPPELQRATPDPGVTPGEERWAPSELHALSSSFTEIVTEPERQQRSRCQFPVLLQTRTTALHDKERTLSPERQRPNSRWLQSPGFMLEESSPSEAFELMAAHKSPFPEVVAGPAIRTTANLHETATSDPTLESTRDSWIVGTNSRAGMATSSTPIQQSATIEAATASPLTTPLETSTSKRHEMEAIYFDFDLII